MERAWQRGRLSHAQILCGPPGIGKYRFARLLAMSLFCRERPADRLDACGSCRACLGFEAGTWPDYIEVGIPAGKLEIPISAIAGAEERRGREGLCYELSMAPQVSEYRIAVINDADAMNASAANALLKTLEEPPLRSLILLVCESAESLLPTIRSRCQIVRFFPLSDADLTRVLIQEQLTDSPEAVSGVVPLAEGSVELATQLLNPELVRLCRHVTDAVDALDAMRPFEVASSLMEQLSKLASSAEEQRRLAMTLLRAVGDTLSRRLRRLTDGDFGDPLLQQYGVRGGLDLLAPALDRILTAAEQIDRNSPVALILEALFDDLARQFRLGPVSQR
jgi:DNA polymerase-3 subunit delta'